jgi:hypothetical protein
VHVFKADPSLGEFVQPRCFTLRMTESTQGCIQIIGHEEKDVWSPLFGAGRRDGNYRRENQRDQELDHVESITRLRSLFNLRIFGLSASMRVFRAIARNPILGMVFPYGIGMVSFACLLSSRRFGFHREEEPVLGRLIVRFS